MQALQQGPKTEYGTKPLIQAFVQFASMGVRESVKSANLRSGAGKFYIRSLLER
jgi:hypothetical protein